jgi:citrate synthase
MISLESGGTSAMTTATDAGVIAGLEGVLACESSIASIDGPNGTLQYRGYNIRDFADTADFLGVTYLLWYGHWPSPTELRDFDAHVRDLRVLPDGVKALLKLVPIHTANPMAVVRTAVSLRGALDPTADDISHAAVLEKASAVLARLPTLVAALSRMVQDKEPIEPDPSLDHYENYLYMLYGVRPAPDDARSLNTIMTLYAEHELNASTFATRTVVGTLSDYFSAVVAGIAALKGPLHGGAVDEAMTLFREIGSVDRIGPYLDQALAERRKIPGFGHRVYRTRDPRAYHLEAIVKRLAETRGEPVWYEIATRVEQEMIARKRINANVDYYAALALYYLGFPLNMFTSVVASTRIAGWTAHIAEQYENNRLIRPRAQYTGPSGLAYRPIGSA